MKRTDRVLILYYRLMVGERVKKSLFMEEFSIGKRTFDRYIEILRLALSEAFVPSELRYDPADNSYYLTGLEKPKLHGMELLPIIYLIFDSGVFIKGDIAEMLYPLMRLLPHSDRIMLQSVIKSLGQSYDEPENARPIMKLLWDLQYVIEHQRLVRLHSNEVMDFEDMPILPRRVLYKDGEFQLIAESIAKDKLYIPLGKIDSFTIVELKEQNKICT